jgi:hypothetical protein
MNDTLPYGLDLLIFAAHPDDAEIGMGGTIVKHIQAGQTAGIIDLTYAEMSSNGDVDTRQREAAEAGRELGLTVRENPGVSLPFRSSWTKWCLRSAATAREGCSLLITSTGIRITPLAAAWPRKRFLTPSSAAICRRNPLGRLITFFSISSTMFIHPDWLSTLPKSKSVKWLPSGRTDHNSSRRAIRRIGWKRRLPAGIWITWRRGTGCSDSRSEWLSRKDLSRKARSGSIFSEPVKKERKQAGHE